MNADRPQNYALPLLIILACMWGSSFILMKKGLLVFSAPQMAALRIFFASSLTLPMAIAHLRSSKVPVQLWWPIAGMAFFSNFLPAFLFAEAQTRLSSSLTGVLNALTPLFTLLWGLFFFRIHLRGVQVAGLLLGLVGSVGLSLIQSDGDLGEMNGYVFLIVAATACYGIGTNLIKQYLTGIHPLTLTSLAMMLIGPFGLGYLLYSDAFGLVVGSEEGLAAAGYILLLATFGTVVGMVLYNQLLKMRSAVFASSVTYLIPLVALLWGWIDGEQLFVWHFVGMLLIVGGVYLVNSSR